jgi:hypothetical protein
LISFVRSKSLVWPNQPSLARQVIVMPKWTLQCPKCDTDFEHSQIDNVGMASFYLPLKPDLPPSGVRCTYPDCGSQATYQKKDLRYRADSVVSRG